MQTMRVVSLLVVALMMLALASANPTVFLGGNFQSLAGTWAAGSSFTHLAAYHRASGQWSSKMLDPDLSASALIHDIAAAGNGVFVVGAFETITETSIKSEGVAFWDGDKWCSIRESINGVGHAVHCDTSTSCWVTGVFTDINNLPDGVGVTSNFAHYTFDASANEWEFDQSITEWNSGLPGISPLTITPAFDRLYAVGSIFFVSTPDLQQIWRGSAADDGWYLLATPGSVSGPAPAIVDWTISGSSLYVITEALTDNSAGRAAAVLTGGLVSSTCGPTPANCLSDEDDWGILVGDQNATIVLSYHQIAVSGNTQYLVALHDTDGGDNDWSPKHRVLSHSGTGGAALSFVGEPFQPSSSPNPVAQMWIDENSNVVVVGPNAGNLFYPANTDDNSGALADRRLTDRFTEIAVFNGSRWIQAFGGGFLPDGAPGAFAAGLRHAYNSATGEFFFAGQFLATYDVHAESAAFFDDDDDLTTPFFPLFSRAISRRSSGSFAQPANVYDIVCATSSCEDVFVGGDFAFHGPDTFGAVAAVAADRSANPEVTPVGGGLWRLDQNVVRDQDDLQTTAGVVYALARQDNYLYAGGLFTHGSRPTNPDFVCLHNIARIDLDTENAAWEDLHAGCDNEVYDIVFWGGLLVAGGEFIQCGGGRVVNYVASYGYRQGDNAQWASLHNGVDDSVFSLEVFQGRLIAAGSFDHAGGLPVTGVASWDGWKWRALLPACTDDCVATGFQFYYTALQVPNSVYDLKTDLSGDHLWARIVTAGPSSVEVLGKWQYTDGDLGRWTVAGDGVQLNGHSNRVGHTIANFGQDNIVLAAPVGLASTEWTSVAGQVGLYHSGLDNWVADSHSVVGANVYVIRGPEAGSASTLSSPLSVLLGLF